MFELHLKIFKLTIDIKVECKCDKHNEMTNESLDKMNGLLNTPKYPTNQEEKVYDDVKEVIEDSYIETPIDVQAQKFAEELSILEASALEELNLNPGTIYDVPEEDIPLRYNISDDVEIITDKFEREVEDIYEGRR